MRTILLTLLASAALLPSVGCAVYTEPGPVYYREAYYGPYYGTDVVYVGGYHRSYYSCGGGYYRHYR